MRRARAHALTSDSFGGRSGAWARFVLLLAFAVSCASTDADEGAGLLDVQPLVVGGGSVPVARRETPALLALRGAVEEGEDELARQLIAGIKRRQPSDETLEVLEAYERILRGRELVKGLELKLASQPDEDGPGEHWIVLLAKNTNAVDVVLDLPPAAVERRRTAIDETGGGGRRLKSRQTEVFRELALPSGEEQALVLFLAQVPRGEMLAVREHWSLDPLAGEITAGDESFPAGNVVVEPFEATLISDKLPQSVVAPDEVLSYVQGRPFDGAEALGLGVRVPRDAHRALQVELLTLVARFEQDDPERAEALLPLLAWLGGDGGGEDDPGWGTLAGATDESEPERLRERLDLPFPPRSE